MIQVTQEEYLIVTTSVSEKLKTGTNAMLAGEHTRPLKCLRNKGSKMYKKKIQLDLKKKNNALNR